MMWPPVAVFADKYTTGFVSFETSYSTTKDILPLNKALEHRWNSDAHAVSYMTVEDESWSREIPRLRKGGIAPIKAMGVKVVATSIWLDLDLPGHVPLDEDSYNQLLQTLVEAEQADPIVGKWNAAYTTRAGMRLIYVLRHQMDVEESEAYHRGLVQRFRDAGMSRYVDGSVFDWTRFFRLPQVMREIDKTAHPSWQEPFHTLSVRDTKPLDVKAEVSALGGISSKLLASQPEAVEEDMPTDDEASELLYFSDPRTGVVKETTWFKNAKKRALNREFAPYARGERSIGARGERNPNFARHIGQSIGILYIVADTGPREIYAFWLAAIKKTIQDFGDDRENPWRDVVWDLICRFWADQMAQAETQRVIAEHREEVQAETKDELVDSMLSWCDHPSLTSGSEATRQRFVSRNAIISVGNLYYILQPDGYYTKTPVSLPNLVGAINSIGADDYIETTTTQMVSGVPVTKPKSPAAVLADHMAIGRGVTARNGTEGVVAEGLGTKEGAMVVAPMFKRRDDIQPRFDEQIDEWLRVTFGHAYIEVATWIGFALAFEEGPICALSIVGPPAIGKKLLATGLAECIDTECFATGQDLIGRFTPALKETGLLVIDEGLPRTMTSDPADTFRSYISGDTITVEEKYKPSISVNNPLRILITANNDTAIKSLYMHRDLSEHDRHALSQRLLHIDVGLEGAKFLSRRGGVLYTAQPGNRWIRGDAGQPSDYVVARHFLHLYERRYDNKRLLYDKVGSVVNPKGTRLLLEGAGTSALAEEMAAYAGNSTELCHVIVRMISEGVGEQGIHIDEEERSIYLKLGEAYTYYARVCRVEGRPVKLDRRAFKKGLANICRSEETDEQGDIGRITVNGQRARWWSLDTAILMRYCKDFGISCEPLEKVAY